MTKILIIEDNHDVNAMLAETLQEAGYQAVCAYDGLEGSKMARETVYDLILLDIMLPYKSGDEVLKELRLSSDVPVIILSAKDLTGTKIDLLRLGADDYITKPFDLGEVTARIESVLRRFHKTEIQNQIHCYHDLTLNSDAKTTMVRQQQIALTAKEFQILELMIKTPGKVFTKANLYESVWQEKYPEDDNPVKIHISNLRNKLKAIDPDTEYIETIWGLGYRIPKI